MSITRIQGALDWATLQLADGESAKLDGRVLLAHCLEQTQTYLFTWPDKTLTEQQWQDFQQLVKRRSTGEPVAHITGLRDFWTLTLAVSPATLIPRPETELLVELVLGLNLGENVNACDLGTGTGAIALALASEQPHWQLVGVDLIEEAVALAKSNAKRNQLRNVEFIQSSWFDNLAGRTFNVIVSNPPYVEPDSPYLREGDVRFEPLSALTADNQGMADIEHIAQHARTHLSANGWLLVEHGFEQGQAARRVFSQHGFVNVSTHKDLNELDRVTIGQLDTCE